MNIKLTEHSHGAGCGCKLSPAMLQQILEGETSGHFENLLVGNSEKDDAAVYQLDQDTAIISTTDFFMPVVDDPFDFGAIAATNAISDIYAMGGKPLMAIAILGWPIDKLPTAVAKMVIQGARKVCAEAMIPLAGGHSIDAPEPIFGLAVTGQIKPSSVKRNGDARVNDLLYLTKPIGVGLVTTAQKKGLAREEDLLEAKNSMMKLNSLGAKISKHDYVHAITDITGFGLAGHALEMAEGSELTVELIFNAIPKMSFVEYYLELGTTPGGTDRNWSSYGERIDMGVLKDHRLLADPQTSGGLLIAIDRKYQMEFEREVSEIEKISLEPIGSVVPQAESSVVILDA